MADYQEYRRRILHRRWRRVFIIVALLALLALLSAIGILWKVLHRERVDTALSQNTILRQVTTDNTWNTVSYPLARQLRVQTLEDSTETALGTALARQFELACEVAPGWLDQVHDHAGGPAALPDLPTVEEAGGLKGFEASSWFGLLAPAGTPPDVVSRIQQEVAKSLATPAMKERLATLGAIPSGNTPAQFAALIESEHKKWAEVVKVSGAKVD